MRAALLVAANDLRRRLRDRSAIVTAFVAPVVLATIVGLAFGGSISDNPVLVRVAIVDATGTQEASALVDAAVRWARPGPGIVVESAKSREQALSDLGRDRVAGVVILPPGFVGEGRVTFPEVRTHGDSVIGGTVAYALAQALADAATVGRQALASGSPDLTAAAEVFRGGPPIDIEDGGGGTVRSLLGYFGPAMAMVFLFFGIGVGARNVLAERQGGTLARLQAAPIPFSRVLAGKLLGMLALSATSVAVVWATTTWVLGATWGNPLGVVVLTLALVLAMGSIALLVTVLARSEEQADAATAGLGFALAMFGGNFFPPGSLPPAFQWVSYLTPNGWGLQGYGSLAIDGDGAGAVVGPVLALLAIAAVFGTAAVARFRRAVVA